MKKTVRSIAMALTLFILVAAAHAQSSAGELDLGVAAYKDSRYDEAIQHFQKAVDLDSGNVKAHMYLATACLGEYIPGVDSEDNNAIAERAVEHYEHVLNSDSSLEQKVNSAKGIAYVYLNSKKFEDSKQYYQMASGFDPKDPELHYSIGTIDWTLSYQPRMEARAILGLKPEEHLNPKYSDQKNACDELRAKNWASIEEGIASLNKAIQLRPDYDDAMAYMNLVYREKADLECDDPAARASDLKTADHWVDLTLAVKKAKAEKNRGFAPPTAPNPQ